MLKFFFIAGKIYLFGIKIFFSVNSNYTLFKNSWSYIHKCSLYRMGKKHLNNKTTDSCGQGDAVKRNLGNLAESTFH